MALFSIHAWLNSRLIIAISVLFVSQISGHFGVAQETEIDCQMSLIANGLYAAKGDGNGGIDLGAIDPLHEYCIVEIPENEDSIPKLTETESFTLNRFRSPDTALTKGARFDDKAEMRTGTSISTILGRSILGKSVLEVRPGDRRFTVTRTPKGSISIGTDYEISYFDDRPVVSIAINDQEYDAEIVFGCELDLLVPKWFIEVNRSAFDGAAVHRYFSCSYTCGREDDIHLVEHLKIGSQDHYRLRIAACDQQRFVLGFAFLRRQNFDIDLRADQPILRLCGETNFANGISYFFEDFQAEMEHEGLRIEHVDPEGVFCDLLKVGDLVTDVNHWKLAGRGRFVSIEVLSQIYLTGGTIKLLRHGVLHEFNVPKEEGRYRNRDAIQFRTKAEASPKSKP